MLSPLFWSGRRGSNPPPIAWKAIALPNELLPHREVWLRGGGWTRTTELFRGQIYSLLQLPLCDSPNIVVRLLSFPRVGPRADEGTRTPDRLITNQLLYQLSYIGFWHFFKQLFLGLRLQNYYFFRNPPTFFQKKNNVVYNLLKNNNLITKLFFSSNLSHPVFPPL